MERYNNLGVIKNDLIFDQKLVEMFESEIQKMQSEKAWSKEQIVNLFHTMIPGFGHKETGKYLDAKM